MVSIDTLYYSYLHPVRSGKQFNEKKKDVLGNIFIFVNKIRLLSFLSLCDLLGVEASISIWSQ